jgi:hypothetical protein
MTYAMAYVNEKRQIARKMVRDVSGLYSFLAMAAGIDHQFGRTNQASPRCAEFINENVEISSDQQSYIRSYRVE